MRMLLGLAALVFVGLGLIAIGAVKSDIQLIAAALCFGFAAILIGQITIISMLKR